MPLKFIDMWRYFNIFLFCFSLCTCRNNQPQNSTNHSELSFDWLTGHWHRINDEPGQQTYEIWQKQSANTYLGKGFTLAKGDTVFLENVILRSDDKDQWSLNVMMKGEEKPTIFKLGKITPNSFECNNDQNSFPKIISYQRSGDSLLAIISGGGPSITFKFGKQY